jgi:hypothetical protein
VLPHRQMFPSAFFVASRKCSRAVCSLSIHALLKGTAEGAGCGA